MKIAILHHAVVLGGGTLSGFDLYKALYPQNEVTLLLPSSSSKEAYKEAKKRGINVQEFQFKPPTFDCFNGGQSTLKVLLKYLVRRSNLKAWTKLLLEQNFDIVILNSIVWAPIIRHIKSIKSKKTPKIICFVRETMKGSSKNISNRYISSCLNKADSVSFLSEFDKREWSLNCKNVVIYEIMDQLMFNNLKHDSFSMTENTDILKLLYLGGTTPIKGPDILLKAISHLKNKGYSKIKLYYLGKHYKDKNSNLFNMINSIKRHNFLRKISKIVTINDLSEMVLFLGIQSDVGYWYDKTDVVIIPSVVGHQARPIFEAGVFKKPAIATNFPNFEDFIKNDVNGLLFDNKNHVDLARCIIEFYENRNKIHDYGDKNYEYSLLHSSSLIYPKVNDFVTSLFKDSK